jgi:hypothetical protein
VIYISGVIHVSHATTKRATERPVNNSPNLKIFTPRMESSRANERPSSSVLIMPSPDQQSSRQSSISGQFPISPMGSGSQPEQRLVSSSLMTLTAIHEAPKPRNGPVFIEPMSPFQFTMMRPTSSSYTRSSCSALMPTQPSYAITGSTVQRLPTYSYKRWRTVSVSGDSSGPVSKSLTDDPGWIPFPSHHNIPRVSSESALVVKLESLASTPDESFDQAEFGFDRFCNHYKAVPGYRIGKVIGKGGFATVRIGLGPSNEKVAVKVVAKRDLDAEDEKLLRREIRAMNHVNGHKTIIKLFTSYESVGFFYVVMEFLSGGSILDYVKKNKTLTTTEACRILGQCAEGLKHCHALGVVHRDVKLENMMLDDKGNLRLIDFGLCAFISRPGQKLRVYCGSPSYVCPEIIAEEEYDGFAADVWSLGVCLFAMLFGYLPFYSSNGKKDVDEKIVSGNYKFPDGQDMSIKSLIAGMLHLDPSQRLTLDKVMNHSGMKMLGPNKMINRSSSVPVASP